jgi:Fe2+ transport system protein FeoA
LVLAITTTDDDLRHKLETMGLIPGQSLRVHNRNAGGFIAEIKGSRLALGMDLACGLRVEKIEPHKHWHKKSKYANIHRHRCEPGLGHTHECEHSHDFMLEHGQEHGQEHGLEHGLEHKPEHGSDDKQNERHKRKRGWFR